MAHLKLTADEAAEKLANYHRDHIDVCDALQIVYEREYEFYGRQEDEYIIDAFENIFRDDTLEITD